MQHRTAWAMLTAGLLIGSTADAAMVTLPEDPRSGHRLDVGIDYENTLRRTLGSIDSSSENGIKRYYAAYARIQYAAHPLLNAYARIGSGKVKHRLEDLFLSKIGQRDLLFESDQALAWGGGLTGGVPLPWDFKVGYDVAYHTLKGDVERVIHANRDPGDPLVGFSRAGSNVSGSLRWQEYQAAAWIAHPIELDQAKLIPYLGAKWSRLTLNDDNVQYNVTDAGSTQTVLVDKTSHNYTQWGAVLGLRLVYDKRLVVVVEGHEGDDESVIGSVHWLF